MSTFYAALGIFALILVLIGLLMWKTKTAAASKEARKPEQGAAQDAEQIADTLTEAPPTGDDLRDSIARRSGLSDDG